MSQPFGQPDEIVKRGRKIYERHRHEIEPVGLGKFVLIDLDSERFYPGASPEETYQKAQQEKRRGPFYLMRVGTRAAFRSRRALNARDRRLAQ